MGDHRGIARLGGFGGSRVAGSRLETEWRTIDLAYELLMTMQTLACADVESRVQCAVSVCGAWSTWRYRGKRVGMETEDRPNQRAEANASLALRSSYSSCYQVPGCRLQVGH